jgi:hypothetical protein
VNTFAHEVFANIISTTQVPQPPNGIEAKPKTIYNVCHLHFAPSMTIKPLIHSLYLF